MNQCAGAYSHENFKIFVKDVFRYKMPKYRVILDRVFVQSMQLKWLVTVNILRMCLLYMGFDEGCVVWVL